MYLVTCPPVWSRWRRCAAQMPRNWSAARRREPKCRNLMLARARGARSAAGPVQDEIDHAGDSCAQLAARDPTGTGQVVE